MTFRKALKLSAKLRLALCGIAGSGKTFSALQIGSEIGRMMRHNGHGDGRIALIDSERGSASLYADLFDFDVDELDTFSPLAYASKIREAERAGYDIIIIDSISHAWSGKDGALDQRDRAAERSPSGNSWTAWRDVTPKHNEFVDAMVMCRAHLIVTMRQKMEHVQETVNGKVVIRKVGLASIQREGMEYEFTAVGDLDLTNTLRMSKTRMHGAVGLGDIFERPGAEFAGRAYAWLMSSAPAEQATARQSTPIEMVRDRLIHDMRRAQSVTDLNALLPRFAELPRATAPTERATAHEAYKARLGELTLSEATAGAS